MDPLKVPPDKLEPKTRDPLFSAQNLPIQIVTNNANNPSGSHQIIQKQQTENEHDDLPSETSDLESLSSSVLNDPNFDMETDNFIEQTTRKRIRHCRYPTQIDLTNLNTNKDNNKYAILGELDIQTDKPSTSKSQAKQNTEPKTKEKPKPNPFCPPIFIYNMNIKKLVEQLKSKNINFKIKNKSRYKSKLYLRDANVHLEMMTLLKEKNIDSYSFTPKELKKTKCSAKRSIL